MHRVVEFILDKAQSLDEEADLMKASNKLTTVTGKAIYADTVDSAILRSIAAKLRVMAGKLEIDIKELSSNE